MSYHDKMDADILSRQLHELGRRDSALRRRGICSHGWTQSAPGGGDDWQSQPCKCLHCGKQFTTFHEMLDERREVLA